MHDHLFVSGEAHSQEQHNTHALEGVVVTKSRSRIADCICPIGQCQNCLIRWFKAYVRIRGYVCYLEHADMTTIERH